MVTLLALVSLAYLPALHGEFLWDDDTHISANDTLRTLHGLWQIWFQPGATCQYYPLTFSVFWLEFHLWGLDTLGYHLVNLLLHSAATILLWQVLRCLKLRGAWLAAALFALHPICVMSAAWMTETKNTLSATLALCSAWAYLRAAGLGVYGEFQVSSFKFQGERASNGESRFDWRFYLLSLAFYQLAMFSKTAVSYLPVTLLLVAWWQGRRLNWRTVWPVLPMFAIAVAMGLLTIHVEQSPLGGATGERFHETLLQKMLISGRSFWFYLERLFIPTPSPFIYERWDVDAHVWWQWLFPAAMVALLAGVWLLRKRIGRGVFVALAHFYVSTSMLILIVVLYFTNFSFVSDHWQYFGCMSVLALVAEGIARGLEMAKISRWQPAIGGALLLGLGALTWHQAGFYRDPGTLWRHSLAKNPSSWLGQNNLGALLASQENYADSLPYLREALQLNPRYVAAMNNLGISLAHLGDWDGAARQYRAALQIDPSLFGTAMNLGNVLDRQGKAAEALDCFRQAAALEPAQTEPLRRQALDLLALKRIPEAVTVCRQALRIEPDNAALHFHLGMALEAQENLSAATAEYRETLRLQPQHEEARQRLRALSVPTAIPVTPN